MTSALPLSHLPQPAVANPNSNFGKHRISAFISTSSSLSISSCRNFCSQKNLPLSRYAVLGAGFAGLSVAWNLLKHSPVESRVRVDIYDEVGIGGGASGVAGGLIHPYSPKAKVLWRGGECWKEWLELLVVADRAAQANVSNKICSDSTFDFEGPIVLRRGIIRPATTEKNMEILKE